MTNIKGISIYLWSGWVFSFILWSKFSFNPKNNFAGAHRPAHGDQDGATLIFTMNHGEEAAAGAGCCSYGGNTANLKMLHIHPTILQYYLLAIKQSLGLEELHLFNCQTPFPIETQ